MDEIVHIINIIMLSMATKQKIFDDLANDMFKLDIFHSYIESLLSVNLELLGLNQNMMGEYQALVELYLLGHIDEPNDIINTLKKQE